MIRFSRHVNLTRLSLAAAQLMGFAAIAGGASGDWPQWRGPLRDNISTETGLLKDWPKEGPKLAWEAKGLGQGYSDIAVVAGKIYTLGDQERSTSVLAFDTAGKKLWAAKVGQTGGGGGYPGPRCTPTFNNDHLYVLSDMGDLVCLLAEDGKEVWRVNLQKDLGGEMMSGWGYAESPTVDGDKVICTPGGKNGTLAAFDKLTGKVIWRSKDLTDRASYASLVPADIGGTHQYVVLTESSVAGIGVDGSVLWKAPRRGKTAVIPTPVVKDNLVFVTSGYGIGCNCFKVEGSGTQFKAEQIYDNKDMTVHHGGVVCVGDAVYGANDGNLTCMSLKDGKVLWKHHSVGKGSVAYADGRIYLRSEKSGDVALVEATTEEYKEHGLLKQPDRSRFSAWPHPVIAGGKLYLRDQDNLLCYDVAEKSQ